VELVVVALLAGVLGLLLTPLALERRRVGKIRKAIAGRQAEVARRQALAWAAEQRDRDRPAHRIVP
jgi:hypothetical protein